jgi:hypothetical protein
MLPGELERARKLFDKFLAEEADRVAGSRCGMLWLLRQKSSFGAKVALN